jgi:Spy/CpxP family protein refolding chaperone
VLLGEQEQCGTSLLREKEALEMKNKLVAMIALCTVITVIPFVARSAADDAKANGQIRVSHSPISDCESPSSTIRPTSPDGAANERQEKTEDYEGAMVAVTQRFSATLAAIAQAVQQGKISSKQGKEMSTEQYQLTQMQFELLSLWREIEREDVARVPDAPAEPAPTQDSEIVMVALPFSSLQLNPSLAEYLSLTPSQVAAIQQVMVLERQSLQPLMTELRSTRERLLATSGDRMNEKEVKSLAQAEAALLAKLIVANARMQSKIYGILSPDQQKKLIDLERTQGSSGAKESQ